MIDNLNIGILFSEKGGIVRLQTLKLDAAWQPVDIISVEKGFSMVFAGRANVVEVYEQGPCHNERFPAVIVLKKYINRHRRILSPSRENIYWRDQYACQYCGKQFAKRRLTLDHVLPKSRGGLRTWLNLVTACLCCNQRKGNRTPIEANMPLQNPPKIPKSNVLTRHRCEHPPTPVD